MKGKFEHKESRGLPGGPNEQFTYVTGVFSTEGYKADSPDVNNPFNIIPSGNITMKGVDFPVMGTDNLGNSQMMMPGNDYQFPGDAVFEVPMAKKGGGLLTKTMKCNSCGWSWKAADGGKDVSTCHKCGGSALPTAQFGRATTQDSLDLYNRNLASMKILESQGWKRQVIDSDLSQALRPSQVSNTLNIKNQIQREIDNYKNSGYPNRLSKYLDINKEVFEGHIKKGNINDYYRREGKLTGANDWYAKGGDNIGDPMMWVHDNIKPRKHVQYERNLGTSISGIGVIDGPYYDPVRIYPKSVGPVPREAYKYSEEFDMPDDSTESVVDVDKLGIIKQPYTPNLSTDWGAVLRSEGKDGSYGSRKKMYNDMGLAAKYGEYKGSANQNLAALNNYKNPTSNSVQTQPVQQEIISQQPKKEFSRYVNIHGNNYGFDTAEEFIDIARRKNLPQGWIEANTPKDLESQTKESIAKLQTGGEYKVKSGDTFDGIANKLANSLGVSKDEFIKANPGIRGKTLQINQTINVPIPEPKEYKTFAGKLAMENLFAPGKPFNNTFSKELFKTADELIPSREGYTERKGKRSYFDSEGKLTGGIGHLLTKEEIKKYPDNTPIPQEQVDKWYKEDTNKFYNAAIDQAEKLGNTDPKLINALASVNFQLGEGWYNKHKNTWELLKKGDYGKAAIEAANSKWYKQTPTRVEDFQKVLNELANDQTLTDKKVGGEIQDLDLYKRYMNSEFDNPEDELLAQKIYDKLNRRHYKNAKQFGMSSPNYIMSHLLKNSDV